MTTTAFDVLAYARKLENAGFTREQAEVQAETMRQQVEAQSAALRSAFKEYDDERKHELATKGDIVLVRGELRETELRLQKEIEMVRSEIKSTELRLLRWQIGLGLALAAIMAKGFGWLDF